MYALSGSISKGAGVVRTGTTADPSSIAMLASGAINMIIAKLINACFIVTSFCHSFVQIGRTAVMNFDTISLVWIEPINLIFLVR